MLAADQQAFPAFDVLLNTGSMQMHDGGAACVLTREYISKPLETMDFALYSIGATPIVKSLDFAQVDDGWFADIHFHPAQGSAQAMNQKMKDYLQQIRQHLDDCATAAAFASAMAETNTALGLR